MFLHEFHDASVTSNLLVLLKKILGHAVFTSARGCYIIVLGNGLLSSQDFAFVKKGIFTLVLKFQIIKEK
ncbi:DNA excision repair protein ERCC-6-like [Bienertia sinuspersici]